MKQSISQGRADYQRAYRWLRLNGGAPEDYQISPMLNDAQDCALLSYDFHNSHFSGWINRQRMSKFHACQRRLADLNWLPF